jgi:hypothetical protein
MVAQRVKHACKNDWRAKFCMIWRKFECGRKKSIKKKKTKLF